MRKWFGINQDSLALEKKRKCEVKHVNNEEFNRILNYVRPYHRKKFNQTVPAEVLRDFYIVCYASGARQSKGFAMRKESLKGNAVFIDSQIRRNEKFKSSTKTGKARRAIFFEDASEALHRWSEFSGKAWIERSSLARNLKNASKKAFPNQPEKWICVHDLRHSYAIRLIRDYEFNLTQTAMFMGNSVVFREEHYANFVMSDENIESLYRAKVKKPSSALP